MADDTLEATSEELIGTIELSFDPDDDRFVARAHFAAIGEIEVRGGNPAAVLHSASRAAALLVESWEEDNAIAEEDVEVVDPEPN